MDNIQGKTSEALKILRKIAETNSVQAPSDLEDRVDKMARAQKVLHHHYIYNLYNTHFNFCIVTSLEFIFRRL